MRDREVVLADLKGTGEVGNIINHQMIRRGSVRDEHDPRSKVPGQIHGDGTDFAIVGGGRKKQGRRRAVGLNQFQRQRRDQPGGHVGAFLQKERVGRPELQAAPDRGGGIDRVGMTEGGRGEISHPGGVRGREDSTDRTVVAVQEDLGVEARAPNRQPVAPAPACGDARRVLATLRDVVQGDNVGKTGVKGRGGSGAPTANGLPAFPGSRPGSPSRVVAIEVKRAERWDRRWDWNLSIAEKSLVGDRSPLQESQALRPGSHR